MPPQGTDLVLTTNIPNVELDVLVRDRLDVEADGGDGGDILAELQLVKDRRLSGSIETEHEKAHFLGSEDLAHHLGQLATHLECSGVAGGIGREGKARRACSVGSVGASGRREVVAKDIEIGATVKVARCVPSQWNVYNHRHEQGRVSGKSRWVWKKDIRARLEGR